MLRRLTLAFTLSALVPGLTLAQETLGSDLLSVYRQALENNADLAAARARYQAAQERIPQARAGLLPQLTAGAQLADVGIDVDTSDGSRSLSRSSLVYQATLSQPLFRADRWFQLQAAQASGEQAALEFSASQQELIFRSAEAYFAVLRTQDALAAVKAEEAALKRQLDQANERFEVGLSDRTDVLQARAGYDSARAGRLLVERQVRDAFENLEALTARPYQRLDGIRHSLPVLAPVPNDASAWVATAARQNLNLQASQFAVLAAEESLRQRRAGHAPTLDAVAQYQTGDNDGLGFTNTGALPFTYTGDASQTSIGLQLNIPLFSGGLTTAQSREARQVLEQVEQQREGLRRQVVQNTRNLFRAVNTDVEQVQARRQAIISSQSALEATEIGYQVGTRNIVDVLDAQRLLYGAVRDYNNARYDYILDNLRLKQVAGTLSPADLQALSAYLQPDYTPDRDFLPPDLTP
ncbi:MAG TPA: TolC family outer membrane protein [Pseudomonas sp.]|nr:TolC family outer membrane protein [Pseudomonas sp.]